MTFATQQEVLKLSKKFNVIPVYKETLADLETPLSAYMKIDNPEYSFLLESVEGGENTARHSFLSRSPFGFFSYKDGVVVKELAGKKERIKTDDPVGEMQKMFKKFKVAPAPDLPARGGAVGYVGYDVAKLYNKIPIRKQKDDLNWPDMYFMFTNVLMIFDHVYHKIQVVYSIFVEDTDKRDDVIKKYKKAEKTINSIIKDLRKHQLVIKQTRVKNKFKVKYHVKKEDFKKNVKKAVKLINAGEGIQTVVSQRFSAKYKGDPIDIYRSLRTVNPSPYMHYLRFGDIIIIGASPEVMVKVEDKKAMVRPIAGTRKRGKNKQEDIALEKELLADEKERAEHVMLIDLGRNDIGKVSKTGAVRVEDLMVVEKYSHVMHIVSNVVGELKAGKDAFDAFKATFPAGTVSGAPKRWAMQVIDDLEDTKRGPYSGAVGYVSYSGAMDTCISLRSIYYDRKKSMAYMQAGAGIVSDSKPEFEYNETMNKAGAVMRGIQKAIENNEF